MQTDALEMCFIQLTFSLEMALHVPNGCGYSIDLAMAASDKVQDIGYEGAWTWGCVTRRPRQFLFGQHGHCPPAGGGEGMMRVSLLWYVTWDTWKLCVRHAMAKALALDAILKLQLFA